MGHLYQLLTPKAKETAQKRGQKDCSSQNTSAVKYWLLGMSSELHKDYLHKHKSKNSINMPPDSTNRTQNYKRKKKSSRRRGNIVVNKESSSMELGMGRIKIHC